MSNVIESQAVALPAGEGERIAFQGVEVEFKSPAKGGEGWTVLEYTIPALRFGAPLHYHRQITESFYVLEGEIWFRVGDEEVTLGPGGFALVPPGILHSFANRSEAPARFLGHASDSRHKEFLLEVFELAKREPVWPPRDRAKLVELGNKHDTVYVG